MYLAPLLPENNGGLYLHYGKKIQLLNLGIDIERLFC